MSIIHIRLKEDRVCKLLAVMEARKSTSSSSTSSWPWRKKSTQTHVATASPKPDDVTADTQKQQQHPKPDHDTADIQKRQQHQGTPATASLQVSTEESSSMNRSQWPDQESDKRMNSQTLSEAAATKKLVEQQADLAQEAVLGWQKAEAEASRYKKQLEEALQQNTHTEDRMHKYIEQISILREEQEKAIEDAILSKSKEWDLLRTQLESRLTEVDHQLLTAKAAMMKSLQERDAKITEITNEKTKAQTEVRSLYIKMNAVLKENSRLKYEVYLLSKEREIRTDEREYGKKGTEILNLENENKVSKLEAECHRLRELHRKKAPNSEDIFMPEIADQGPHREAPASSTSFNSPLQQTENPEHLKSMDGDITLVKETLARRNNGLQLASANMYERSPSNILYKAEGRMIEIDEEESTKQDADLSATLESQLEALRSASSDEIATETNLTAQKVPDQGACIEADEINCAHSWASAMIAELAHFKKDKASVHEDLKMTDLSNLGNMANYLSEVESIASCSEIKKYGDKRSLRQEIELRAQISKWGSAKHPMDMTTDSKVIDGPVGSKFCISVTEIVKLVKALAHPLLYKLAGETNPKKSNKGFTDCRFTEGWKDNALELSEPDLQLHIDKLVLLQEKAVEFDTIVSNWVVVDFLEELTRVLNRLVKIALYRNAQRDGCSDDDYDDNISDMSGLASVSQQQSKREKYAAKGNSLSFNADLAPNTLGHHFYYSTWKNDEDGVTPQDFPLIRQAASKSSASKGQMGDNYREPHNDRKHNQELMAKNKEIQNELKMDRTGDNGSSGSNDHPTLANEEQKRAKKKEVEAGNGNDNDTRTQSKAGVSPLPSTKDLSFSASFVEKEVTKEGVTYTPRHELNPRPHPSLNSKHHITTHSINHPTSSGSSSTKFFDFNSNYLKMAVRSTISKTMSKSDLSSTGTTLLHAQKSKSKSSNKLLTRLLSLGHTSS